MFPILKSRVSRGEVTVGTWLSLASASVAEVLAASDFDWMVVDVEHSAATFSDIQDLIRVIKLKGLAPLVRVSQNDEIEIRRVMDLGAAGVVVPMVRSAAEARSAVASVRYPPLGVRGVGLCRANDYGRSFSEYVSRSAEELMVIVQIEHRDAIENIREILSVDGVDASIIGPYDLSASLGQPGAFDAPAVLMALATYESVSKELRKPMGFHVVEPLPSRVLELTARGYSFIAFGADFIFLQSGASAASQVRAALAAGKEDRP